MVSEEIIEDMDTARDMLSKTDYSIVIIKKGDVITKKQGEGIRPILETIEELGEDMKDTIVGDRILGKASALLCVYSGVSGVYSPHATKTAIAILIRAGIPGQADKLISHIKNRSGDDVCPFEKMLANIDSAEEAYKVLKKKVIGI